MSIMGLSPSDIRSAVEAVPQDTPNVWAARTEAVHRVVKEARKQRLLECHPDVCHDEDAQERAQLVNRVADELLKFRIQPVHRPPPQAFVRMPMVHVVIHGGGGGWCTSTTSYTSTSGGWEPTGGF